MGSGSPTAVVFVTNPQGTYSGGRYHALMLAEAMVSLGWTTYYVTNGLPIFYEDFQAIPHHAKVRLIVGLEGAKDALPANVDHVFIVPGTSHRDFYDVGLEIAFSRNAHITLVNFESENWFNQYSPVKRPSSAWAEWRRVAAASSSVLSITREGDEYARRYYKNVSKLCRFDYAYPPINHFVADQVPEQSIRNRILLLGRFSGGAHKGADSIVDIIAPEFSSYVLTIIVGVDHVPNYAREEIEARCRSLGVALEWKHKVSDLEKFLLYKQARLLLFPSLFEGYGYPPVEALYCGCGVVAFDLPVLRETCGDRITYARHGDWGAFRDSAVTQLRMTGSRLEASSPVGMLSATASRLEELAKTLSKESPDYSVYRSIYRDHQIAAARGSIRDRIVNRARGRLIGMARRSRQMLKGADKKVTYFPRFRSQDDLTNHYHRAAWYLPKTAGVVDKVVFGRTHKFFPAGAPDYMHSQEADRSYIRFCTSQIRYLYELITSDVVLRWNGSSSRWLRLFELLGIALENVDTNDLSGKEYGSYPGIVWRYLLPSSSKRKIIEASYSRFRALCEGAVQSGYTCAAVFGTGPSIDSAFEFDFSNTFAIVCNSTVQNQTLLDHISPKIITAGDAVSHFGVSAYAAKFRADLVSALRQRDMCYFGTATFGYILALHFPDLVEKLIFIEQGHDGPNYDLLEEFSAPKLDSTMNIHMLPIAATVSNDIYILGCDGRRPDADNEDFWVHSAAVQYHDLVYTGHLCHPTFDLHRQQGTYVRHEDSVRSTLEEGERKHGKRYRSLRVSYIQAFSERQLDDGWYAQMLPEAALRKISLDEISSVLSTHDAKADMAYCDVSAPTLLSVKCLRKDANKIVVSGWYLTPHKFSCLRLRGDGWQRVVSTRKKRPDVARLHPFYRQVNVGFEIEVDCEIGDRYVDVTVERGNSVLASRRLVVEVGAIDAVV